MASTVRSNSLQFQLDQNNKTVTFSLTWNRVDSLKKKIIRVTERQKSKVKILT